VRLPDLVIKNPGIICDFSASAHLSNLHKSFHYGEMECWFDDGDDLINSIGTGKK
jgi:hypothetical protein